MPRMTARKKQAMEMRAKIQNAALDLFDREGFDNVSMAEIAEASGCSVGNIYNYFRSKDELAIQLTDHVDAAYDELEAAYRQDGAATAMEKLLDFVGQSLLISSREAVLYTTFIHSMKYPQQGISIKGLNGHSEIALYVDTFDEVDAAFRKAVENGAVPVLEPELEPWGQRTCYIADPEGNLIEIGSWDKPYEEKDK